LATFEKNKGKGSVQREIEARAKLAYEQNKRDRLADEESKK
jgi:stalled ribosome alternative rescue factor ArfA